MVTPVNLHHFNAFNELPLSCAEQIKVIENKVNQVIAKVNLIPISGDPTQLSQNALEDLASVDGALQKVVGQLDAQTIEKISTSIAYKLQELASVIFPKNNNLDVLLLKTKIAEESSLLVRQSIASLESSLAKEMSKTV